MKNINHSTNLASHFFDLVIGKILTSRLSLSKHLAHNLGNLLLLGKIGVFHNRRNASSRLLLLISKHLILCIYLVFLIVQLHFSKLFLILKSGVNHTSRGSISTSTLPSIKLRKCSSKIITSILSFISGRLATKSNQIKQLIRNGRSASLQRTFKKSFTSCNHSTRNKARDGLIRVRIIRALNGRFNTSITHAYSIVIGSKHITLKAASGGIQGDVLATDNNTVGMGDAGIKSAIQCSNVPNPDEAVPSFVSGAMAKAGKGLLEGTLQAGTSAVSDKLLDLVGLGGKSAADKGKYTRDYLAAAFPELNAWERAGADASSAGMVDAGFENQKELTKMQLDNQKEIAEMQNETQKEIAGIQSATSCQNTKDQVYAQNEMLAYQQKESTARVASIMENTNLSKQQQVSEIMRQMLTQAQTAGQYFTNDQIKEMTRKVSAEVDLVHQQTQNQRYGSSHIGATAKDISNVVTDAASGVVDIFHGIDKAVADTWNNFWKVGKADGIGSNLSRKYQ